MQHCSQNLLSMCRSDAELKEDPEENTQIVERAQQYLKEKMDELDGKGGSWKHYVVGHSLGGSVSSCLMVDMHDRLEQ